MLSARNNYRQASQSVRLMERHARALEMIAARLGDIDLKLERMLRVVERDNPATTPF